MCPVLPCILQETVVQGYLSFDIKCCWELNWMQLVYSHKNNLTSTRCRKHAVFAPIWTCPYNFENVCNSYFSTTVLILFPKKMAEKNFFAQKNPERFRFGLNKNHKIQSSAFDRAGNKAVLDTFAQECIYDHCWQSCNGQSSANRTPPSRILPEQLLYSDG